MNTQVLALIERLIPRLVSAGLVFSLAAFTNPTQIGIYTLVITIYTGVQSVTETSIRQLLPELVRKRARFLNRYLIIGPVTAATLVCTSIIVIAVISSGEARSAAIALWPIILVPIATTAALPAIGDLQLRGGWKILARGQLYGAICSLAVSLPILATFRSTAALALQLLLAETICTIYLRAKRSHLVSSVDNQRCEIAAVPDRTWETFLHLSLYSGLAWSQAQLDRAAIGIIAGPARLGVYSLGTSLTRALSDPHAASTANVLRAELQSMHSPDIRSVRQTAQVIIFRAAAIAALVAGASVLLTELVARPILGARWDEALDLVPILAIATIPASLNWSGSVLQVQLRQVHRATLVPIVGLATVPITTAFAIWNLPAAAWTVVVRELLTMTVSFGLARQIAPWRAYFFTLTLVLIGVTAVLTTQWLNGR